MEHDEYKTLLKVLLSSYKNNMNFELNLNIFKFSVEKSIELTYAIHANKGNKKNNKNSFAFRLAIIECSNLTLNKSREKRSEKSEKNYENSVRKFLR